MVQCKEPSLRNDPHKRALCGVVLKELEVGGSPKMNGEKVLHFSKGMGVYPHCCFLDSMTYLFSFFKKSFIEIYIQKSAQLVSLQFNLCSPVQPTLRSRKGMSPESGGIPTTPGHYPPGGNNYFTENLGSLKQCIPPPTQTLTYNERNR